LPFVHAGDVLVGAYFADRVVSALLLRSAEK